jgi:hypothetical protein
VPASESAYEFGVVCEARADQLTACDLADRVLLEGVDWLEPSVLEAQRQWRGLHATDSFLKWTAVRAEAERAGLRISTWGLFNGSPGEPDAFMARKALLLFASLVRRPDAVLLVRDSDGDSRRIAGLEQARRDRPWPFKVIIGVAHPKREAWVIAGFQPQGAEEAARLRALQERLSFDPIHRSHELDARKHGAKTDIKRALEELIQSDGDRERQCLNETGLEVLEDRGGDNGLAAYLSEVRERLVPILSGRVSEQ